MNHIHPTAVVGDGVQLGDGNVIGPFAVLLGPLRLGSRNWIGPHVVIGTPAEIRGIDHGAAGTDLPPAPDADPVGTGITIGDDNVLREYTTVHQGHYGRTVLGSNCYIMNKVYIGHDNVIGDAVTMASSATLGGHVHVDDGANLGMGAIVHQRRVIGATAMVGMGSVVTRDIAPYALAYGNPCRVHRANTVGMTRAGIAAETVARVDAAYRTGDIARIDGDAALTAAWNRWHAAVETADS
ncbi:MAG TPA: UDP-N-acetylglucosamine acyltransferase [Jatrophihabitantaceae bacterium]|nr:UDP-N-acetylglucosamine acyltransferase [Jatrophihabitantaceae bacterium]